jgi:hypothetical protein
LLRFGRAGVLAEGGDMSEHFEEMSRALARGSSRRSVLKMMGVAVATATAATVLRPFRSDALCETGSPVCGETCCQPNQVCANASTGQCACQAGLTPCGEGCCPKGLICADANTARCGCDPSIRTFCGNGCCNKTDTCSDPATVTCCCKGDTPCGTSCCKSGVACIDVARGLCGCSKGLTPCGSGASLRCCPKGTACPSNLESSGCGLATTGQGQGPGYATQCGCQIPCGSGCPSGMVCQGGCCKCAAGICGLDCCNLIGECCDSNGCCFGDF